jgi:arylsulfatase
MGLTDSECRLTKRDKRVSPWGQAQDKNWQAERMAVYAAQIECMDRHVGRILTKVKDMGVEDNTLVIFLSDNGASDQSGPKNGFYNIPHWRLDGKAMRTGNDPSIMPGPGDTFASYGPEWANVSNTPFRQYKGTNHEGGIATPLVVRWPAVIKQAESVTHQVGHVIDIMATLADVAGATYPSSYQGRNILPLEGKSLLPVFHGQKRDGHRVLCWEQRGNKAIRMGKWKLVALRNRPWELYNLETDRTEISNLAAQQPDIVRQMEKAYLAWATRCNVIK